LTGGTARITYECDKEKSLTKRKKPKPFRAVKAVKGAAREKIGQPPAARVVPDKTKKADEKHKLTLDKLLDEG
jgi:hypothetical protein